MVIGARDLGSTTARRATSILFVGDVVAAPGRRVLRELLPALREELALDFVVVNGENAAGGIGITPKTAGEIFDAGADAITLGNHTYRHREAYPYLDAEPRIVRPANFLPSQPGRGTCLVERDGVTLGVVNLSGNLYMQAARPAFVEIESALAEVRDADHVLVDMHAEATSEKVALGWHLDGRVTAVVGTHTHVPDQRRSGPPPGDRLHHRRRDDRCAHGGHRGASRRTRSRGCGRRCRRATAWRPRTRGSTPYWCAAERRHARRRPSSRCCGRSRKGSAAPGGRLGAPSRGTGRTSGRR